MSVLEVERAAPTLLNHPDPSFHYSLRAYREPSVLSRVIEMFALRDLIPHQVDCREVAAEEAELQIDVAVRGLDPMHARHLADRMRNIVPVRQVALEVGG